MSSIEALYQAIGSIEEAIVHAKDDHQTRLNKVLTECNDIQISMIKEEIKEGRLEVDKN